jgi:hypothetical protein
VQSSRNTEDVLFARDSLYGQLRAELAQASGAVTAFDADLLLDHTEEEVLAELIEKAHVPAVQVFWERAWSPDLGRPRSTSSTTSCTAAPVKGAPSPSPRPR